MIALLKKEISQYFASLTGYVVIFVFLLINGLFLWIIPTEFNIIDNGYAYLDNLFMLSPWLLLFIIPAITMRSFSEEKKNGTLEIILTKPISELQLTLSKFFANLIIVLLAISPTIVYYLTIYNISYPIGNVDSAGIFGSYIGLLMLSATFVSFGIFSSSITDNQVVAFIISITLCLFAYIGFEYIYSFNIFGKYDLIIKNIGISPHYSSLSRGVIDIRDVIYFLSTISIFILLTKTSIESRKW